MKKSITVLLPAFNEGDRIEDTILSLKKSNYIDRIVVIDDGSIDETFAVAKKAGAEVYALEKNRGKGFAMNFGIKKIIEDSSIVIFLDADTGNTAIEGDKLIEPLLKDEADVTIAKFPAPKKKGGFGLVKNLAKYGVKMYTGQEMVTVLSGQRAFKSQVLEKLGPFSSGYGVEVGMTIDILNLGFKIKEVDVVMTHRETGRDIKGFIHRGRQFYHILLTLFRKSKEVKGSCLF